MAGSGKAPIVQGGTDYAPESAHSRVYKARARRSTAFSPAQWINNVQVCSPGKHYSKYMYIYIFTTVGDANIFSRNKDSIKIVIFHLYTTILTFSILK